MRGPKERTSRIECDRSLLAVFQRVHIVHINATLCWSPTLLIIARIHIWRYRRLL